MSALLALAQNVQWWHWWVAAAVLAVAETLVPGAIAIWFGASAVVVGALVLVVPVPWQLQLLIFAVLGVVACFAYRRLRTPQDLTSDQPSLNKRAAQYVGESFTLIEPLSGGNGKVQVGDTTWLVRGPDARGRRARFGTERGAGVD
jgi:membrane protein implicated in regulation of membrane protease activity